MPNGCNQMLLRTPLTSDGCNYVRNSVCKLITVANIFYVFLIILANICVNYCFNPLFAAIFIRVSVMILVGTSLEQRALQFIRLKCNGFCLHLKYELCGG